MEEKKTKKIDLVVVMAILILIAFIGVMSFAMVQGIMQYTKKDAVAYADGVSSNLLYLSYFSSISFTTLANTTINAGEQLIYDVSLAGTNIPFYSYFFQNNATTSKSMGQSFRLASSSVYVPLGGFDTIKGLMFPLVSSCSAGAYTFVLAHGSSSNVVLGWHFYTLVDDVLVSLDDTIYFEDGYSSSNKYFNFTASVDFDNIVVTAKYYNSSHVELSVANSYDFKAMSLLSGTINSYTFDDLYVSGFNAGYYTGLAPSDEEEAQLDVVGNNLFDYQFNQPWDDTYAKLVRNGDIYKGWQIHASGSAMYNYDEVNSLSVFKYYGSSVSYNYDFYYYLDDFDSGDYTFSFNYDYGDIDAHDFKLLALTFTIPETDPVSEETLAYIQDDNADVTLTATYYQGRYLISISCMLSSSADLICRYAKLETGSNFTGFVPLDYYNYGYNQGYQNGQGDLLGSRNYILLDYLSFYGSTRNLTSDFVFNNTNYVYGDWTEDLNSLYNYNNPNFAVIDSLDGAPSGSQVGYKYENENLYGDILLMMPYCDDNLRVVFEVVDSGEVLITSPRDTVHWTLNSHLGNVNSQASWSCDLYTIHFYSPTQVNIYFLPYQPLDYGTEALYLPLNTKSWRVYSTQTNTALSSFDDGYLNGLEQGKEQQAEQDATLIARARGQGYEEGRRDALEDANDYSFMGLIGSVIDAPIASFKGLLNFSILGVNMQSFVLAILTLCVIIIVIKIALGGK